MEEKIDEVFEMLGNNKKVLIVILVVYIIFMLVMLTVIWWPEEKYYATYEAVDITKKQEQSAQSYLNTLTDIFKKQNTSEFKWRLSEEYIKYTGKTVEQITNELTKKGYFSNNVEVKGMNIYTDGNTYVYSATMYSGNNKRNINIIERYPYKYEFVLDDFYSYEERGTTQSVKNINFVIERVYNNLKYIEIDMKIENKNDTYARFDFTSTVGVQAVLEDGTTYPLANLISGEKYTNIEPNMIVSKNFIFEIPAQLQDGIEYIMFKGVSVKFSESNMQIFI